jgi:SAM-dependent methyltransferase
VSAVTQTPDRPNTIAYYERNAEAFFRETIGVDMRPLYGRFLTHLPTGGQILDAGCGSGRDLLAFRALGYCATGFDASSELVALASKHSGQEVYRMDFRDIRWRNEFHGIWACASMLHISRDDLPVILQLLATALVSGGILYASFKYGTAEREKGGRCFTDMDESGLTSLLEQAGGFAPLEVWTTADRRPGREDERWLNALLRKIDNGTQAGSEKQNR